MIDLHSLPHRPGCYLFRDARGRPLYIGKALDLRNRVSSYFHARDTGPRIRRMLQLAKDVDFLITDTEVEAFLLENTLIKKHQPRFNVDLKDAKTYAWLRITAEPFPRIVTARRLEAGGEYFGPFVCGSARNEIRATLNNIFGLRTCRRLPSRPCLRFHMGTCSAPCSGEISQSDYALRIRDARQVLKGGIDHLISRLESRMREAARNTNYEHALHLRDRVSALKRILDKQHVQAARATDADIIHYRVREDKAFIMRFSVRRGMLENKEEFEVENGAGLLEEFLCRFYAERPVPREVILPEDPGPGMRAWLRERRKGAVELTVPQRGDKRRLLELVHTNLSAVVFGEQDTLGEIKQLLDLNRIPFLIECFDISHHQGSAMVASMVRFRNGRPDPGAYRRYRIREVIGVNDPAAIAEVVRRRYSRLLREGIELPDLAVVDGGIAQREAAARIIQTLGIDIPVIALAKREEAIYTARHRRPLLLDRRRPALRLLQRLRDESHRFALAYHRSLRIKEMAP